MKKLFLMVLVFLLFTGKGWAQYSYPVSMKNTVVTVLMDYGVKLYDRHDYTEAQAVFNRVLFYNANQEEAIRYLNRINPHNSPIVIKPLKKIDDSIVAVIAPVVPATPMVDDASLTELKERIKNKQQDIDLVKSNIANYQSMDNSIK